MAKCLVLGGNGFLGSHLVDSLAAKGFSVRVFDRFSNGIVRYNEHPNVEQFAGDFLSRDDLSRALDDVEYVFHFISTTTPITAENDPLIDIETNVKMSVVLFEECAKRKIKKVIFASTGGAIYGSNASEEPIAEIVMPQPISPYAIGKLSIENYLHYFRQKFDLPSVVYRISNPYGERQALNSKQGVIPIFLERIAAGKPVQVFGDGSMVRDYIYIKDMAEMITSSFESAQQRVYNLGSGEGASLMQLIEVMKEVCDQEIKVNHSEKPATFLDRIVLDTSLFRSEFNLSPTTNLHEGIKSTWEYYKDQS